MKKSLLIKERCHDGVRIIFKERFFLFGSQWFVAVIKDRSNDGNDGKQREDARQKSKDEIASMTYVSGLNGEAFASPLAAPLIYWLYLFSSFIIFGISLGSVIAFIPEVKYAKSHEK